MSKSTPNLGLHIWEIPKDNNEKFDYVKSVGNNFEKVDEAYGEAVDKFTEPLSYKGEVETYEDLPTKDNKNGDIYNVASENKNYIWNGTEWVEYSSTLNLTYLEDATRTTKTTDISEELEIKNCAGVKGSLDIVSGKSFQETRSGKNLCINVYGYNGKSGSIGSSGGTYVKNQDGTVVLNGKIDTVNLWLAGGYSTTEKLFTLKAGTYTLNDITLFNFDGTNRVQYDDTFTISEDKDITGIRMAEKYNGGSFSNQILYPQVEAGNNYTGYEQHGVSPSPDYPSPIRNVGEEINLFDFRKFFETADITNGTKTLLENGFKINCTQAGADTRIGGEVVKGNTLREQLRGGCVKVKPNNSYTIICDTGFPSCYISWLNNSYMAVKQFTSIPQSYEKSSYTFTADNETEYLYFRFGVREESKSSYDFTNIKVIADNETIDFKVENKNIIKINDFSLSQSGITATCTNNKLKLSGTATANTTIWLNRFINFDEINKYLGKQLTISTDKNIVAVDYGFTLSFGTISNVYYMQLIRNTTITKELSEEFVNSGIYIEKDTTVNIEFQIQFEKGNVKTSFIPHKEQIVSFPLEKGQVLHEGDYLAEDGIHQNRETLILNGTETWYYSGVNTNERRFDMNIVNNYDESLRPSSDNISQSSHFKRVHSNIGEWGKYDIRRDGFILITDNNSHFADLQEFANWLKEQKENGTPVIVEYKLAEEKIIPYTEKQKEAYYQLQHLLMYEEYTRITCLNEIKPDIQATYYFDNEINNTYGNRIDKLEEKVIDIANILPKNSGAHNSIYRGKDITELFYNGTLSKQIEAGTFDDVLIGDYIIGKTSGRKYLVADIDYRLHTGDTECTKHHILMIPEKTMGSAQMNATNITTGAYIGSEMYTKHIDTYRTIIKNDFGAEHILNHREHFQNAVTNGYSTGGTWYNSEIDLMNELMVYGTFIFTPGTHNQGGATNTTIPNLYTIDKSQLSLFRLKPDFIIALSSTGVRDTYWLRDVVSSAGFAAVASDGAANSHGASYSRGVRPAFLVY